MFDLSIFSLESILDFSTTMGIFLIALAALIFVHELGHFLVARMSGVVVEKFSLGFGPKIVSYTSGKTEYLISAIPLGGYVKMKGEDPGEELTDPEGSFSHAPVKNRLAIAFAGPLFNILFAVFIYFFVYLAGVPTAGTTVGLVMDDTPAKAAGLQTSDRILELDGEKVLVWNDLLEIVHNSPGKKIDFLIEREKNRLHKFSITPVSKEITDLFGDKEMVGLIGITPLVRNVNYIKEGSPADLAGIKVGDKILSIDGTPMRGWSDLKTSAVDKPGKKLTFIIERNGAQKEITLTPKSKIIEEEKGKKKEIGVIGVGLNGEMVIEKYGFFGAIAKGVEKTWDLTYLIAVSIKKLFFGSIPAESIGGPILIFQIYEQQAEQGFQQLIWLTALLSINLGLINLLPIPILDGGHIFFFLIELLKGKPVSEKYMERAQQVGIFMLISLMIFAFYNDIMRIIN